MRLSICKSLIYQNAINIHIPEVGSNRILVREHSGRFMRQACSDRAEIDPIHTIDFTDSNLYSDREIIFYSTVVTALDPHIFQSS